MINIMHVKETAIVEEQVVQENDKFVLEKSWKIKIKRSGNHVLMNLLDWTDDVYILNSPLIFNGYIVSYSSFRNAFYSILYFDHVVHFSEHTCTKELSEVR